MKVCVAGKVAVGSRTCLLATPQGGGCGGPRHRPHHFSVNKRAHEVLSFISYLTLYISPFRSAELA